MLKWNISKLVFLLILLPILCLGLSRPQKGPQSTTGAPLKGVDVKLGKNPGSRPAARTTTDGDGNFSFPVLPAGDYVLSIELKKAAEPPLKYCYISLTQTRGRKIIKGYDIDQNKSFDAAIEPTKQTSKLKLEDFVVHSDGTQPINGTIVKSKSNISNN